MARTIGVVTVARSDWGIYLPVLRRIQADPDLELRLIVGGMHLSPEFGMTVNAILADGFQIHERVEMLMASDSPEGLAKSIGVGVMGFAQVYARGGYDMLMVLGDRFEMLAAATASLPFNIPIAHLHGGESTEGLIDEPVRHSITKMSHLHFASTEHYARRIRQMGEEPWRVMVSGAPSLDNLRNLRILTRAELSERFGVPEREPYLLATIHPVTLEYRVGGTDRLIQEVLEALRVVDMPVVFTYPNADTRGRAIISAIESYAHDMVRQAHHERDNRAVCLDNVGTQAYFSLMAHAAAMVGNSSSGIIEAASFHLPVVNVGERQRGRIHAENVIDAGTESGAIIGAIRSAVSPQFQAGLAGLVNPYGDGHASERIVERLKEVTPFRNEAEKLQVLLMKRFHEPEPAPALACLSADRAGV